MIRVCRPGGRVWVADVAVASENSAAYDRLEIMRNPSHTHALTGDAFSALFKNSGLTGYRRSAHGIDIVNWKVSSGPRFPNRATNVY